MYTHFCCEVDKWCSVSIKGAFLFYLKFEVYTYFWIQHMDPFWSICNLISIRTPINPYLNVGQKKRHNFSAVCWHSSISSGLAIPSGTGSPRPGVHLAGCCIAGQLQNGDAVYGERWLIIPLHKALMSWERVGTWWGYPKNSPWKKKHGVFPVFCVLDVSRSPTKNSVPLQVGGIHFMCT